MTSSPVRGWIADGSPDFPRAAAALSASAWQPDRSPAAVARPSSAREVPDVVLRARDAGHRLAVRSGGHSLSATHLVDGAVTLDLGALRGVAVDRETATAWVGPGTTVHQAARALDAAGCSFPLGHAPTVGLGGYLLAGGNGWNTPEWGHGCERVVAADVVLADGAQVRVDALSHTDLFHALRGAGPAFPGVVTAFQLQLVAAPTRSARVALPVDAREPAALGAALDDLVAAAPAALELTVFWRPGRRSDATARAVVSATMFGDDAADALETVRSVPFVSCPPDVAVAPTLGALVGTLPRHHGEAMFSHHTWTHAGYRDVLPLLPRDEPDLFRCSSVLLTTAARRADGAVPADSLYMPAGTMSVSAYAHWQPSRQRPDLPVAWARRTITDLDPLSTGRYVGEADLTDGAAALASCFPRPRLKLLQQTSARYDPDRLMASPLTV